MHIKHTTLTICYITLIMLVNTCTSLGQAPIASIPNMLQVVGQQIDQKSPASKLRILSDRQQHQSILDKIGISRDIQPIIWGYLDTWHFYKKYNTETTSADALISLFSPHDQYLVYGDSPTVAYTIAQIKTDTLVYKNQPQPIFPNGNEFSIAFRPTGGLVVTAQDYLSTDDYNLTLFDAITKQRYMAWDEQYLRKTNSVAVYHCAVSPDGKLIATTEFTRIFKSRDCMYFKYIIKIWEIATQKLLHTLRPTCDPSIKRILFSPDGKSLALLGTSSCTIEYLVWHFEKNLVVDYYPEFTAIENIKIKNAFFISPAKAGT